MSCDYCEKHKPYVCAVCGARLSRREREVFRLLILGFTSKEIAAHLQINYRTARLHEGNIYKKIRVRPRSRLIAQYYLGRIGWLGAEDVSRLPSG